MNTRDLGYIVAVADLSHFGKAAKKCFVSQPTLSMQIKKLEGELGVEIFERTKKQVIVTLPGQKIVQQAREVLLAVDGLKELARQAKDPLGGVLRLGVIPTVGPYLLPHVLPLIRKEFPNLLVAVVETKTDNLFSLLHRGEVDVIIVSTPAGDTSDLVRHSLFTEPFYVVLNKNNPLSQKAAIPMKDLFNQNVLLLEEGHCLRQQVLDICMREHIQNRNDNFLLSSLETLYYIIVSEGGISLFPSLAIKIRPEHSHIAVRPFLSPIPSRHVAIFWRATSPSRLLCTKITTCITQWASTQRM